MGLGCWHGDHCHVDHGYLQPVPKQRGQCVFLLDRKHVLEGQLVEEMRRRKKKEEKERRAEREGERKPRASDSHSGLRSVLCV